MLRDIPGTPEDWLSRSRGDLALARAPLPSDAFYEDLCFHAQQAAEKALKAIYVRRGWTFRYVHDLDELITGLRHAGLDISEKVDEAVELSAYAFEARYPGVAEPVTENEYQRAVTMAEHVVRWAEKEIEGTD